MRSPARQRLARLAVLALLVAAVVAARRALGVEWNAEALREAVARLGLWAPFVFVLLVAFRTPLLLPSQVVLLAGGLLFGTAGGTAFGALGIWLSGIMAFALTRWLAGAGIRRRVPAGMQRTLDVAGTRGGAAILALATAWPVGALALYHAAAGLTRMGFPLFLVALGVGSVPRAWTYSYFGSSLVEGRWLHVGLAAGILALAVLPLAHPEVRRFLRRQFEVEPDRGPGDAPPGA
jgi:uncharacterized membrane protein YdjX (TVP38/TMEM64 family)